MFSRRLNDKKRDAIVIVMQRLHEDDLAQHVLDLGYTHLCLPAEAEGRTVVLLPSGKTIEREDGDLLWPEREGPQEIAEAKTSLGSYGYAGQYQQRPVPAGGGLFKREWFKLEARAPAKARRVRYWDKAASEGKGAFTAGVLLARTSDDLYYVEDVVRGQWSSYQRDQIMRQTAVNDRKRGQVTIWVEQEPGSGGKESAELTLRLLSGFDVHKEPVTGDKESRARPFSSQCEAGNVRLVKGSWNAAYLDELCLFPHGRYADQVDASGGAFTKLALRTAGGARPFVVGGGFRF